MKHIKKTFTPNRKLILLNFGLMVLIPALSLIHSLESATFINILLFPILYGIFFPHKQPSSMQKEEDSNVINRNTRQEKNPSLMTSNPLTHKNIVLYVMWISAVVGWIVAVSLKSPTFSALHAALLNLFIFQLSTKLTLFILDLPIGTFFDPTLLSPLSKRQNQITPIHTNAHSQNLYYSPAYRHLSCNMYFWH